jgi:hypothetical protein
VRHLHSQPRPGRIKNNMLAEASRSSLPGVSAHLSDPLNKTRYAYSREPEQGKPNPEMEAARVGCAACGKGLSGASRRRSPNRFKRGPAIAFSRA